MQRFSPSDKLILVLGGREAGKTHFINVAAGRINPKNDLPIPNRNGGVDIVRITPLTQDKGIFLVDTLSSNNLDTIASWIRTIHSRGVRLAGIICMFPISDRILHERTGNDLLEILEFCGEDELQHVSVVTTMWDRVERDDGTKRERGLRLLFCSKLHKGYQPERFYNSYKSAWKIINNLLGYKHFLGLFARGVPPSSNRKSRTPITSDEKIADSPYKSPSLPAKTRTVASGKSPLPGTRNAIRTDVKSGNAVKSRSSPPELSGQVQKLKRNLHFNGTYSNVYHGKYKGQKVAIKEIRAVGVKRVTDRKFQRELQIWWKLRHTNILPLFGYIDEDDSIQTYNALISPWIAGGNAAEYIRGEVSASQRLGLFYDVVKGLEYLHNFNPVVVHGDLKPLNVLVTPEGVGQICDFGLTRLIQEEETTGLTTTTAHAGTARYLAYELVVNMGSPEALPTTATDIYALGCLGMEFIYCILPHHNLGDNLALIYRTIGDGHPPVVLPDDDDGNISLLWDLLERCWATRPIDRPTISQIHAYLKSNGRLILDALNN